MQDVRRSYVPPGIDRVAFNCPHCGALAKQYWFSVHAEPLKKDETPLRIDSAFVEQLEGLNDTEDLDKLKRWAKQIIAGRPFLNYEKKYCDFTAYNLSVSRCFSCDDISIWMDGRLIWPVRSEAPLPNPDLPDGVRDDYQEASVISDLSPRGAAALLRLSIQKLCKHLGENGNNLNADIAALVKKGLECTSSWRRAEPQPARQGPGAQPG